ncbi:MAG: endopeptidase La [Mailhella sp.]|nr:endopeptidase La [Mailhella sp.]MBQ3171522.1 endopeptidase La [Mailhella sp.]
MSEQTTLELPVITLREVVMFPGAVMTFHVGRSASVNAINSAVTEYDKHIFLVAQTNSAIERPGLTDLFMVGVVSRVQRVERLQDGTIKLVCEGLYRASWLPLNATSPFGDRSFPRLRTRKLEEAMLEDKELPAVVEALQEALSEACRQNRRITPEQLAAFALIEEPGQLADAVAPVLKVDYLHKQAVLEILDKGERLRQVYQYMGGELVNSRIDKTVKSRVKAQMEQNQREYYLTEQIKAIHKELGHDDVAAELLELEEQLKAKNMPEEPREKALREVHKLRQMQPGSAEYVVGRNYVDWILDLPWNELKEIDIDLDKARGVLDGGHYGLEKAKTRILEYLAVQKLSGALKGPILCLVGPPGVGKTSLAKSIAEATGREFVRISLGGVRDEAEIRGHRRTYIGALPGKIIMALKRAKSNNPLFCLDEIDKMTVDFRGDPASALLEVLDPEQNSTFNDHYLDLDYDLSQVFFITTANSKSGIPAPLLDRMEVLELSSYLEGEKVEIARQFLLPRQWKLHGLKPENMKLSDNALLEVIRSYTRESGVRNLEREIAALCRKVAIQLVEGGDTSRCVNITLQKLAAFLGVKKYRYDERETSALPGVVAGLAYTGSGGDLLYIETVVMPGSGKVQVTGKLGEVMKESAQAAFSWLRSLSCRLGLRDDFHKDIDLHIHVPEGAVPKDGPSAGITLATSLASALLGIPVRNDVCMTGEITLRGRVLPIGGLREKLLAARRSGMKTVLIPADNEKDLKEVPEEIVKALDIQLVSHADDVLPLALLASKDDIFSGECSDSLIHSLRSPRTFSKDLGGAVL